MAETELDPDEEGVAELAVQALNAATRRALAAGHSVLMVENGALMRVSASSKTMIRRMPPRIKVAIRSKRASK